MRLKLVGLLIVFLGVTHLPWFHNKAHADCFDCCSQYNVLSTPPNVWYAGVAYTQSWVQPRNEWRRFFYSNVPGTGFYFGRVICDLWSIELGYEWGINKLKSFEVPPGTSILGVPNFGFPVTSTTPGLIGPPPPPGTLPPGIVTIKSKVRLKTGYIDFSNYIPIYFCDSCFNWLVKPNIILTAGVGNVRPKYHIFLSPTTPYPIGQVAFVQGKSKAVFRLGLGFQGYFYKNFGFRVLGRWLGTSALRGRGDIAEMPRNRMLFSNTYQIHLGVYFSFADPLDTY